MRFPVKPPGTKMNKTQYCYMFSRVVSPFEPVQARVYRSSSRESLLNWDITVCYVWFNCYYWCFNYYYWCVELRCFELWCVRIFVLLQYMIVGSYLKLALIICPCNTTCSTHHFTHNHTPPCGHAHARSAKMYVSEW